jgi:hypothetical protein
MAMSVMRDVPRSAVRASLWATRLPLTVVEALRGDRAGTWTPVLVFDGVAATVREFAGGVLRDDELVQAGRMERARVAELKRATELEATAIATRQHADAELEEQRSRAEQERERAARQTRARKAALQREREQERAEVEETAEVLEDSVRETEAKTKEQLAKQQRATRKARLQAEREVLQDERRAVAAEGAAVDADRELRATKAARRSTRPGD